MEFFSTDLPPRSLLSKLTNSVGKSMEQQVKRWTAL
ncbi:hypothetical protein QF015_001868 [Paenarthrobacter sp. TE4293]